MSDTTRRPTGPERTLRTILRWTTAAGGASIVAGVVIAVIGLGGTGSALGGLVRGLIFVLIGGMVAGTAAVLTRNLRDDVLIETHAASGRVLVVAACNIVGGIAVGVLSLVTSYLTGVGVGILFALGFTYVAIRLVLFRRRPEGE